MIPVERAHLEVAAGTDPGLKGKNNEDQFSISAYQLSLTDPTPSLFAIVADGIGGHRAGEVASEIAVETISQAVSQSDASRPVETMQASILKTSEAILAAAESDLSKRGMGTTVVCAWIIADKLYVTYVGNSRLYLLRNQKLSQLTNDHTWVQEAVEAGALTPEQARVHPHANIIRRYLGSSNTVEVDTRILSERDGSYQETNQGMRLRPGDRLLLCSDGLSDMVEQDEIGRLLQSNPLHKSVDELIEAANRNGGKDNITVVVIQMPHKQGIAGYWERLRSIRPQMAIAYAGLAVMGIAVLVALLALLLEIFER